MKKIIIGLLALGSLSAFSYSGLEMTGFKVIEENSVFQNLSFNDRIEFKISKERFSTHGSAIRFCKNQGSKLDTEFNSLLIAMSGAASISQFLNRSITFKIKDTSGILQWSKAKDKVTLMFDGRGTNREEVLVKDLNKVMLVALPAICVKDL